jgi:hypothetical protein
VSVVNDTNSSIACTGASWGRYTNRGFGDYQDDVQAATANGDSATVTFTGNGTGISLLTETNSDEGTRGLPRRSLPGQRQRVLREPPGPADRVTTGGTGGRPHGKVPASSGKTGRSTLRPLTARAAGSTGCEGSPAHLGWRDETRRR